MIGCISGCHGLQAVSGPLSLWERVGVRGRESVRVSPFAVALRHTLDPPYFPCPLTRRRIRRHPLPEGEGIRHGLKAVAPKLDPNPGTSSMPTAALEITEDHKRQFREEGYFLLE